MTAPTEEELGLRGFVREIAAQNPSAQPDAIAAKIADATPGHQLHDFYIQALIPVVADILRHERNRSIKVARRQMLGIGPRSPYSLSPNLDAIRHVDWGQVFSKRIRTSDGWKQIADCTADELDAQARQLRSFAEGSIANAEFYEHIAKSMRNAGAVTARQLTDEDLQ